MENKKLNKLIKELEDWNCKVETNKQTLYSRVPDTLIVTKEFSYYYDMKGDKISTRITKHYLIKMLEDLSFETPYGFITSDIMKDQGNYLTQQQNIRNFSFMNK